MSAWIETHGTVTDRTRLTGRTLMSAWIETVFPIHS